MRLDRRVLLTVAAATAFGSLVPRTVFASDAPLVAAAADLRWAMEELTEAFAAESGVRPRVVFGSSGEIFYQIAQGAPFELFLSADESYVLELHRRGVTEDAGTVYAIGRLVVFAPDGSPLDVDPRLEGLSRALAAGSIRRFAIADPAHAPYGMRAKEALERTGLWQALQERLLLGSNVAQAAAYALAGQVDGALFALSLALAPTARGRGRFAVVDDSLHAPLRQRMVLLPAAGAAARAFYAFLQEERARAVLVRFGFALPAGAD